MRKHIVAGNWKMNTDANEARDLLNQLDHALQTHPAPANVEVVVVPPFPFLPVALETSASGRFQVGAQNSSEHTSGAYTGEVSATMLASLGVQYVLVGHSERRQYFEENNHVLAEKVNKALQQGLIPIYCCGETLDERRSGDYLSVIEHQVQQALFHLSEAEISKLVLAYEPVWAIGTGETASPEQAQEVHAFLRSLIRDQYGDSVADELTLLYGGSCKPTNASALFAQPDIDGGLIGGASLKAEDFAQIIYAR